MKSGATKTNTWWELGTQFISEYGSTVLGVAAAITASGLLRLSESSAFRGRAPRNIPVQPKLSAKELYIERVKQMSPEEKDFHIRFAKFTLDEQIELGLIDAPVAEAAVQAVAEAAAAEPVAEAAAAEPVAEAAAAEPVAEAAAAEPVVEAAAEPVAEAAAAEPVVEAAAEPVVEAVAETDAEAENDAKREPLKASVRSIDSLSTLEVAGVIASGSISVAKELAFGGSNVCAVTVEQYEQEQQFKEVLKSVLPTQAAIAIGLKPATPVEAVDPVEAAAESIVEAAAPVAPLEPVKLPTTPFVKRTLPKKRQDAATLVAEAPVQVETKKAEQTKKEKFLANLAKFNQASQTDDSSASNLVGKAKASNPVVVKRPNRVPAAPAMPVESTPVVPAAPSMPATSVVSKSPAVPAAPAIPAVPVVTKKPTVPAAASKPAATTLSKAAANSAVASKPVVKTPPLTPAFKNQLKQQPSASNEEIAKLYVDFINFHSKKAILDAKGHEIVELKEAKKERMDQLVHELRSSLNAPSALHYTGIKWRLLSDKTPAGNQARADLFIALGLANNNAAQLEAVRKTLTFQIGIVPKPR